MKKETILFWGSIVTLSLAVVVTAKRIQDGKPDSFTPAVIGVVSLGIAINNF